MPWAVLNPSSSASPSLTVMSLAAMATGSQWTPPPPISDPRRASLHQTGDGLRPPLMAMAWNYTSVLTVLLVEVLAFCLVSTATLPERWERERADVQTPEPRVTSLIRLHEDRDALCPLTFRPPFLSVFLCFHLGLFQKVAPA